jgi:CBS domain-containing protein
MDPPEEAAMEILGKAKRVRIYVSEGDRAGGKPLHLALLELLRKENAKGATVLRGVEGFGAAGVIHVAHLVDVAPALPIVVEWIDRPEQVERLLPRVRELVVHRLVTIDDTDVLVDASGPVRDLAAGVTVAEVMSKDVSRVGPATPVREVVELMLGRLYRAVPVVEGGRPVGIVTNGDLVHRGGLDVRLELARDLGEAELREMLARLEARGRTARDVMTPDPVTIRGTASLRDAAEVMARRRLKRLPVVDDSGALVGIVSRVDLLRTAAAGLAGQEPVPRELALAGDRPVANAMRRDPPTVRTDTPLPEVFQAVISTRLNRALVVDGEGRPVGLVTDAELLERVTPALREGALRSLVRRLPFGGHGDEAAAHHARGRTAADVMSHEVATAREDVRLAEAIAAMLRGGHKVLAVVDGDGRLVGIVDRADLLHGLVAGR